MKPDRVLQHIRNVAYKGYQRTDGLWDIEAEMSDVKEQVFTIPGDGVWQPGVPFHHMQICVTVDASLVVHAITHSMPAVPHVECPQAQAHMHRMVGCSMMKGWRKAIQEKLGGIEGCTHLRELLYNMATAAFQTVIAGVKKDSSDTPAMFLGQCMTWDAAGPAALRHYPKFYKPRSSE